MKLDPKWCETLIQFEHDTLKAFGRFRNGKLRLSTHDYCPEPGEPSRAISHPLLCIMSYLMHQQDMVFCYCHVPKMRPSDRSIKVNRQCFGMLEALSKRNGVRDVKKFIAELIETKIIDGESGLWAVDRGSNYPDWVDAFDFGVSFWVLPKSGLSCGFSEKQNVYAPNFIWQDLRTFVIELLNNKTKHALNSTNYDPTSRRGFTQRQIRMLQKLKHLKA